MNWVNCQDASGVQYVINLNNVLSVMRNPDDTATIFQVGGMTIHITKMAVNTRDTIFEAACDPVERMSWDDSGRTPSIETTLYL